MISNQGAHSPTPDVISIACSGVGSSWTPHTLIKPQRRANLTAEFLQVGQLSRLAPHTGQALGGRASVRRGPRSRAGAHWPQGGAAPVLSGSLVDQEEEIPLWGRMLACCEPVFVHLENWSVNLPPESLPFMRAKTVCRCCKSYPITLNEHSKSHKSFTWRPSTNSDTATSPLCVDIKG